MFPIRSERVWSARSQIIYFAAMLALDLALAGCDVNLLQPKEADAQIYVLNAEIPPHRVAKSSDKVLLIPIPRAQAVFDSPFIAYTKNPLELDYYTKSKWADTPGRMLAPLVVRAMEDTGAFKAVVTPPTPVDGDLRLEVEIVRLQQEFWEFPSRVRFTLRAELFEIESRRVVGTQVLEVMEAASEENAFGGVQAANTATLRILEKLRDFVMRHLAGE